MRIVTRSRGGPAAARDPELFEEFYRRHVDAVTRLVARRCQDPHTVADLTAEVFLAVIDSGHTYRPDRGAERAWLFGVAAPDTSSEVAYVRGGDTEFSEDATYQLHEGDTVLMVDEPSYGSISFVDGACAEVPVS
ncbi:hypothetical protein GCM10022227_52210 [Streptomyces sedi]